VIRRNRRHVLAATLAVLAGTLGRESPARPEGGDDIATLLRSLPDLDSAVNLGRLALVGRSTDLARETALLARALAAQPGTDLRERFDALCAREMQSDRVIEIGGWRFAASEVRLCIVAALSRAGD
jgi:hypothetical protein